MTTFRARWLLAGILLVAVAAGSASASARKQCLRTCAREQPACRALAHARVTTLLADCSGDRSARAGCRHRAHAVLRTAVAACRRLRQDCRACCRTGGQGPACPVGRPVKFDPPPLADLAAAHLPRLPDGSFVVLVVPGAELTLDQTLRDPVTALGACTRLITRCVDPGTRSIDDCARSAPPCATDRPWEETAACCPPACFEAYQQSRRGGVDALAAYGQVYFKDASCFPGLRDLLGGAQP